MFNKLFKKDKIYSIWEDTENYEKERQNEQQQILDISLNNKLFLSDINKMFLSDIYDNNITFIVLDLGSGYCSWSKKVEKKYPNFCIFNIDIINYYIPKFELMYFIENDLKKEKIKFKDNTINFIYNRDMITVYETFEWDNIINEMYRVLIKDGFFEIVEYDISIKHNIIVKKNISDIFDKYLKDYLKQNNFEYNINNLYNKVNNVFNIQSNYFKIRLPLYYENKYEGKCFYNYILGLKHFKKDLDYILKSKYNIDFDKGIEMLENEIEQNQSYMELNIIYGKKTY